MFMAILPGLRFRSAIAVSLLHLLFMLSMPAPATPLYPTREKL